MADGPPSLSASQALKIRLTVLDRLIRAWDRTSIYLPVLLMGLLALVSYWVVGITPSVDLPSPEAALHQSPDSVMRDFSVRVFDSSGAIKSELTGREMRHYPHNNTSIVDHAQGFQIAPNGRRTTFSAQQLRSNDDQSIYWLRGRVLIIREPQASLREPRMEFRGEELTFYVDDHRLESSQPVQIIRGVDTLSANSLRYDDPNAVFQLQGRVRASMAPRRTQP
jgi:lipopolysaccharide export system protein LptC